MIQQLCIKCQFRASVGDGYKLYNKCPQCGAVLNNKQIVSNHSRNITAIYIESDNLLENKV